MAFENVDRVQLNQDGVPFTVGQNNDGLFKYDSSIDHAVFDTQNTAKAVFAAQGTNHIQLRGNMIQYQMEIDHNQQTSQGVVWASGSARPSSPQDGQRFFDNDLGQPIRYDGTD